MRIGKSSEEKNIVLISKAQCESFREDVVLEVRHACSVLNLNTWFLGIMSKPL